MKEKKKTSEPRDQDNTTVLICFLCRARTPFLEKKKKRCLEPERFYRSSLKDKDETFSLLKNENDLLNNHPSLCRRRSLRLFLSLNKLRFILFIAL